MFASEEERRVLYTTLTMQLILKKSRNCFQFVDVNGGQSAYGKVTCGVPQGSILGPLLFTIYVNDMVQEVNCDLFLYADDSALVVSGKDPAEIESRLSAM